MLSAEEICSHIEFSRSDAKRLVVVPRPDLDDLRERNAVSLDVRLGRWFINFKQTKSPYLPLASFEDAPIKETAKREHFVRFGEAFTIHPGSFVLGATLEWLRLPASISGQILGKSSLGRHGLVIETASGVHPHFSGCLTLEMANLGEVPLQVYPGMKIAQIFFYKVKGSSVENRGAMSGNRKPTVPRIKPDTLLQDLRRDGD